MAKKSWTGSAQCPKCGQPAQVGWSGETAWQSGGEPIRSDAKTFTCADGCELTPMELAAAFPTRLLRKT